MKTARIIAGILFLLLFIGCGSNSEPDALAKSENSARAQEPIFKEQSGANKSLLDRKLIKTGELRFETNDLQHARQNIENAVVKFGAYISDDQQYNYTGQISQRLQVRLPSAKFDAFLAAATFGVEKFDSKEISVQDITEEFVDIQARLKTKKELESRYLAILTKAASVSEMLEVEKQLEEVRSEIESIEGRLKYLKNQVSFSTLTINFYKNIGVSSQTGNKLASGFRNGWNHLVSFFLLLVNVWPFLLIAGGIVFWWRKRRERMNRPKKSLLG